jgi:PTS system nitrogen regulatory IIA component
MQSTASQVDLVGALERGGVDAHIAGDDRYEVFRNVVQGLPEMPGVDREWLLDRLLAYENSGGTPIGDGIAIPHPRYPLLVPLPAAMLRVCYLDQPLDFSAWDGVSVGVLFFLLCATADEHCRWLSSLAAALQTGEFRQAAKLRCDASHLSAALQRVLALQAESPPAGGPCITSPWSKASGIQ